MAIVKMKKLRLVGIDRQEEELLRELMLIGCVEISEPTHLMADPDVAAIVTRQSGKLMQYRTERTNLQQSLKILDSYAPEKSGLLSPKPEAGISQLMDEERLDLALQSARELIELDENVRRITAEESRIRGVAESLEPWSQLDLPLDCTGTESCRVELGLLPAESDMGEVTSAINAAAPESQLFEVSSDKNRRYVVLVVMKDEREQALEVLRDCGFSGVSMQDVTGSARDNIRETEYRLRQLGEEKQRLSEKICGMADRRMDLKLSADNVSTKIDRAEAAERMLHTGGVFAFEGWVTAPQEEKLKDLLGRYDCAWETLDPEPEEYPEVPIKLKSNALTEPYNMVTGMYSLPSYNGLDPNPFVMPAFALFFGIMFADMAYGLIMLLAGLLIIKKARPSGTMKDLAGLMVQCGISTFIIGFLTGGFFGDAVSVVGSIFGKEWTLVPNFGTIRIGDSIAIGLPLNLLEGNNPLYVLIAAMGIGLIHLAVGVGIGVYLKVKDGQWLDALLNDVSWWVMFAGIAVMVLGGSKIVLFVGIGMMVLGAVLGGKGFGRVTGVFGAVYNGVTGYLGDVLSYSRLMALMLAGSVIASVFNQLGSLGGILLFIPVFIIGHALNFGLNIIGCFVHTMRLQFLEFFGKWYRDGGRPFRPLTIKTKYVDIKEEM